MIEAGYAIAVIVAMTIVTILLRAAPFLAASWLKRFAVVERLGRFLPSAIMALLLIDTLRGNTAGHSGGLWQELVAIAVAIALQWRTRQPLLSILAATLLYVAFRNLVVFS